MQEYILDSNILIYYIKKIPSAVGLLKKLKREYYFISVVTTFEVLAGSTDEKDFRHLNEILHTFAPMDLNSEIMRKAILLDKKDPKKLKFKDLLIAATAQVEGLTLVTADKDFQKLKGLKVKLVKL